MTLGRYPELTVEQARKEAHKLLGQIAVGRNPPAEKKSEALQGTTLQQAFDDFIVVRKKLKARTLYDYQRIMKTVFADWQNKAMLKINKDMVAKRHSKSARNTVKPMPIYPCAFYAPCLILPLHNMKTATVIQFCGKTQ